MALKKVLIVFVLFVVIAGLMYGGGEGYEDIRSLKRPGKGGEESYELMVFYGDFEDKITVNIGPKKFMTDELDKVFSEASGVLLDILKGENDDLASVESDLRLVESLPEYDMKVSWYIEDTTVVDYWGNVYAGDVFKNTKLIASVTCQDEEREFTYFVTVNPKSKNILMREELDELIRNADFNYRFDDNVALPTHLRGEGISYLMKKESPDFRFVMVPVAAIILLLFYRKRLSNEDEKKRRDEMLADYPEIVTKLSLLTGAGLTAYNSLMLIAEEDKDRHAYKEIKKMASQLKSGISQREVYSSFGERFGLHCYGKLGTVLEQSLLKGNERLRDILKAEAKEALMDRKARAVTAGEKAGTKLLLPMIMLLGVVMAVIMIPAFMSF